MAHDGFSSGFARAEFARAEFSRTEFLGLDFTALSQAAACEAVRARAHAGGPFAYVVTPNVDHIVGLEKEPSLRARLYRDAWLTLNDSRVLELMAQLSGVKLPVATGADLAEALLAHAIDPDEPVTIVGGDAGLIAAIAARYRLNNVRWRQAPMGLKTNPEAIEDCAAFIARAKARYAFICVGAPQQEMIARAVQRRGDATGVGLCVGASLEFLAGRVPRAPLFLQQARLEWLWRLSAEPRRLWRRYLADGPRILPIWYYWLWSRTGDAQGAEAARASISARNAF
ncbi:MAG: WecB/TagA/CpsF family glycosyltransferase [Hyphomonadaceae bacterium]